MNPITSDVPNLSGYAHLETLSQGSRTVVYRALRSEPQQSVVVKALCQENPRFGDLVQFRNQYEIARHLNHSAIVSPLALERYGNGYALIMPDEGYVSLSTYWPHQNRDLSTVLALAIQLAEALHYLIKQRIIHKDIKPANLLIHPETGNIQLIDFSIASLLPKEQPQLVNPNVLEGTLAYLSPEQTGRMNRGIDYRTDFYSLGVTLFELLVGELPFQSTDPMELVHCHMARPVSFAETSQREIPAMVRAIILKLMAKNAEDRYQSALGLKHDLELCLQQWQSTGEIVPFTLAERDACERFLIPERLYGRETEVQTLLDAFERVAGGQSELMLVAGFSGIGKTAVVREVHKPITRQKGYFIQGKFDQFNRDVPFSAFVLAFRNLMGQLLSESDQALARWKDAILDAVGANGQVILEVIPELERIIGPQPAVPELSGSAAQNRFNLLFGKFVRVFTTPAHPLVIFLDDLQWADSASLHLLKLLMSESASGPESGYLLVLGAYRDNEVFAAHPLMLALADIEKQGVPVNTLTLTVLDQPDIARLVADTLLCSTELAKPLSQLVYQKTQGNPFFTTQFLQGLEVEGCIVFDDESGFWQCDLAQVRQLALTDDVVAFMVGRLRKLPEATQDVLKLAACIGNQFDLATLAVVCDRSQEGVSADLWQSLQEGLVIPESETYKFFQGSNQNIEKIEDVTASYRFLHDRVQQAAYSLIPDSKKKVTHLKMGQLLLENTPKNKRDEKIFTIVNQFNYGIDLLSQEQDRNNLIALNLVAGRKAKSSVAYAAALDYFLIAQQMLTADSWETQYQSTLELYGLAAETAYLNRDFDLTEQLSAIVLKQSKTLLDSIPIHRVRLESFKAQGKLFEALDIGIQVLRLLGVDFPDTPHPEHIQAGMQETQSIIAQYDIADLANLSQMTNSSKLAIMNILVSLLPAAFNTLPLLFPLITFEMLKLSLEYGNTSFSAYGYACYGWLLCGMAREIELGSQFGQVAQQIADQLNAKEIKPKTNFIVQYFIKPWKCHLQETVHPILETYKDSLEIGDMEHAGWAAFVHSFHLYTSGKRLNELQTILKANNQAIEQIQQETPGHHNKMCLQATLNLLGESDTPCLLTGRSYDETSMVPLLLAANSHKALCYFHFHKLMLFYLFSDYSEAIKHAIEAKPYSGAIAGLYVVPLFNFYESLAYLARYDHETKSGQEEILNIVTAHQELLEEWAKSAPMNHQHKFHLIEAERFRVLSKRSEALEMYDLAITGAQEHGYLQEEALANELATKFYLDWGKEKMAASYLQEAYYCYTRWGAKAKTDQLEAHYPQLLRPILKPAHPTFDPLGTLVSSSSSQSTVCSTSQGAQSSAQNVNQALDLMTILKASQRISSTIDLQELFAQLTQIVLQNSGADRCAILLGEPDGQVQVRAIATVDDIELSPLFLQDATDLPVQLIQYVKHTSETVVMDHATSDLPVTDPDLDEAVKLQQEVIDLRTRVQGADHWQVGQEHVVLKILQTLDQEKRRQFKRATQALKSADKLEASARYADAQRLIEEALAIRLRLFGEEHTYTAAALNHLAVNLDSQGKFADAEPLHRKALAMRLELHGEEHPDTAESYNNLGLNADERGQYMEAQPHLEKSLEIFRRLQGEEHTDTASGYSNLAANLHVQGKFADAEPNFRKALEIKSRLHGEDHLETANALNGLAQYLNARGKFNEAQRRFNKVLSIHVRSLGENHPMTAASYSNVASNLDGQGKYAEAQPLHQKALDISLRMLGEDHVFTIRNSNNLASNLQHQGKFAEAKPFFEKILETDLRVFGEDHPYTGIGYINLASNLDSQGKFAEAKTFFDKALEISIRVNGEEHPTTSVAYNNLATNLNRQRKLSEAQLLFQRALESSRRAHGENHPDTVRCANNLAMNLQVQGNIVEAESVFKRSIDFCLNDLGENHPLTVDSYNFLATNLAAQGRHPEAQSFLEKALELGLFVLGQHHPKTADIYNNIAISLYAQGKEEEAVAFLRRAIVSFEGSRLHRDRGIDRAVGGGPNPRPLLAAILQAHAPEAAWGEVERSLARGLLDQQVRGGAGMTARESESRTMSTERLAEIQPQLLKLVSKPRRTAEEQSELDQLIRDRNECSQSLTDLATAVSERQVASGAKIQSAIRPNAALLFWLDVTYDTGSIEEHFVCVIRREGEPFWARLPGSGEQGAWTDDDASLVESVRDGLRQRAPPSDLPERVRRLRRQRIEPVLAYLNQHDIDQLMVVGVNAMAGLPVEVLAPEFTIHYVPSGTFLAQLPNEPVYEDHLLAVGDPIYEVAKAQNRQPAALPTHGLLVQGLAPGGAAEKVGLAPGDVLLNYAGTDLKSLEQLRMAIVKSVSSGESAASVQVWRLLEDNQAEQRSYSFPLGPMGVILAEETAPVALAQRRQSDVLLAQLRSAETFNDLAGTRYEVQRISELFESPHVLLDGQANERVIDQLRKRDELRKFRYIHFATHGKGNDVAAFESRIILSQDSPKGTSRSGEPWYNNEISAREVLDFWKLNADLVTLSACESGLGVEGNGDGLLGFAQAFLLAGARSVCLSLWEVDDTATALLMTRFYQNLLGRREGLSAPLPKAEALQEAKHWLRNLNNDQATEAAAKLMRGVSRGSRGEIRILQRLPKAAPTEAKPFADPRYWSAFILLGEAGGQE